MFSKTYKGKKVLVTGHTGFKGAWLCTWLVRLEAYVIGVSNSIPTNPSLFEVAKLSERIDSRFCDVRDLDKLCKIVDEIKPDFVFHLAAQAIVSTSYISPDDTITTNVIGTANLLEALRRMNQSCVAVVITSDKCYENNEWSWGYRENDPLGGKDIYSGSKAAAEIIFHSYFSSFFNKPDSKVRLATGRAGNVIGGGDWAKDRIIVDCMRNWSKGLTVEIRNPHATRPWQHVLEPLSGYLSLGAALVDSRELSGESFNFGPRSEQNRTVLELIGDLGRHFGFKREADAYKVATENQFAEATLLKLNCDKALFYLQWEASLNYSECVEFVGTWYYAFYNELKDAFSLTIDQIEQYEIKASNRGLPWVE